MCRSLSLERRGGRRERGEPGAAVKRAKVQKGWTTKMTGLHRKEPPREGEFRLGLRDAGRTYVSHLSHLPQGLKLRGPVPV